MKTVLKGFVCAGDFSDISRRAVLIENGRIAAVQKDIIGTAAADKIYSFKDEIIAPGFIDAHGHSDLSAPAAPECFSKISQGITSEVCGNCGLSPFPVTGNNREHLEELYSNYALPVNWDDHHTYCRKISEYAPAVKLFALCGHNTLRAAVAGYEKRSCPVLNLRRCAICWKINYVPALRDYRPDYSTFPAVLLRRMNSWL